MTATTSLTCPKCRADMNSYERNGIVIDQCTECRGIFLDRGELERLIEFAGSGATAPAAATEQQQWQAPQPDRSWRQQQPQARSWDGGSRQDWDDDSDSDRGRGSYDQRGTQQHGAPRKKKKSILSEFLDFG